MKRMLLPVILCGMMFSATISVAQERLPEYLQPHSGSIGVGVRQSFDGWRFKSCIGRG